MGQHTSMFEGPCFGGPYAGHRHAFPAPVIRVALRSRLPGLTVRPLPGAAMESPSVAFGAYEFDHTARCWWWKGEVRS